ncbi:MAG: DUF4249 domain-containing protein [Draconibacterium sp.]
MKTKTILTISVLTVLFLSCEKEVNLDFNHESKPCINCVLNPDSLIHAHLSFSGALNHQGDLVPVEHASILLYENDEFVGELKTQNNGHYKLNFKPKAGGTYNIEVQLDGYKTITASTSVPDDPDITYKKDTIEITDHLNRPIFDMNVSLNDKTGKDFYWLYETWTIGGRNYGGANHEVNAPFVDDFNRTFETDTKYGFTHFLQIRLTDEGFDGQVMEFTIPDLFDRTEYQAQHFLNADEHYDKYIKTTIINKMKEDSELPFYEPVQIYSNVENGYGIFGSCSITTVKY